MREIITITLQTTTPIWTGGIGGVPDRLHETGIVGSLRWWYEAIVRGLGGHACDPTSDNKCNFDQEKYDKSDSKKSEPERLREAGLCDACQVFGATGWKRRFRLEVDDSGLRGIEIGRPLTTSGDRYKHDKKGFIIKKNGEPQRPTWYFKGSAKTGRFVLKIIPIGDIDPVLIQGILRIIQNVGGLAAKNQMGCGGIQIVNEPDFHHELFLKAITLTTPEPSDEELPNLRYMFFLDLVVSEDGMQPLLNLKYDIRKRFRDKYNDPVLRHYVCGTVRGGNMGSKIFSLQAKDKTMKVWGWIPNEIPSRSKITRTEVVKTIADELGKYGKIRQGSWKEFHLGNDLNQRAIESKEFLQLLLQRSL